MKEELKGIIPAVASPCDGNDVFLEDRFADLVRHLYSQGADGMYVCGATGDCFSMSVSERKRAAEIAVGVAKDFGGASIIHVAAAGMRDALDLAGHAAEAGAAAVSSMPPANKTYAQLVDYYTSIARASQLPVLVYHIPGLTGCRLTLDEMVGLLDIEGVVGLKFTDYDIFFLRRILMARPEALIFNGSDEILCYGLLSGAAGGVGMFYNIFPKQFKQIYEAVRAGKIPEAIHIQRRIQDFLDVAFRYSVIPVLEHLLKERGFGPYYYRHPRQELDEATLRQIAEELRPVIEALEQ